MRPLPREVRVAIEDRLPGVIPRTAITVVREAVVPVLVPAVVSRSEMSRVGIDENAELQPMPMPTQTVRRVMPVMPVPVNLSATTRAVRMVEPNSQVNVCQGVKSPYCGNTVIVR